MGRTGTPWHPGPGDEADGVRVRQLRNGSSRIELDFYYKGVRCRERLKMEVTPTNWRYAVRYRSEVFNAIERGTFRYGDFFPGSKRAAIFGQSISKDTVGALLRGFLERCELAAARDNMSKSTVDGYRKIIENDLIPEFEAVRVVDLNNGHVRQWILKQECTAKTMRNKLSPLRCALDEAVADGVLALSPINDAAITKAIEKVQVKSDYQVDPFDSAERAAFMAACANDEERDMYAFWFETGLRPGELIALQWDRIDWTRAIARIDRNIVAGVEKGPKTDAGERDVELTAIAVAALQRQRARAFREGGQVWREPRTMLETRPGWSKEGGKRRKVALHQPWASDHQIRNNSYEHVMRKAKVRWRNMYQIRHTYASTHASNGANLFWLAEQMGHKTIEMLITHYARWIPNPGTEPGAPTQDGHSTVTPERARNVIALNSRRK